MNKTPYDKIINKATGQYSVMEQDEDGVMIILANGGLGVLTHKECCKDNLIKAGLMDFLGRLKDDQVSMELMSKITPRQSREDCIITNFVYQAGTAPLRIVKSAGKLYVYNDNLLTITRDEDTYYQIGAYGEIIANVEYPKESGKETEVYIMPYRISDQEELEEISNTFGTRPWQPAE